MTDKGVSPKRTRARKSAELKLDALLDEREALRAKQEREKHRYDAVVNLAKQQRDEALEGVAERIESIDAELATYVKAHLRWLLLWFSRTMHRPSGTIKFVVRAAELEVPEDDGPIIDGLERLPDGEDYIRTVKELDRRAFLQAPPSIVAAFRHLGVRRVPHDTISVQSLTDAKSKQVAKWAAAERTRRSTPSKQ